MRRFALAVTAAALVLLTGRPIMAASDTPSFEVETSPFTVAQAPDWQPDGNGFIYHKQVPGEDGVQLFTASLDGSNERCLTCGQPGPNQVAHYRPQADKILFHSHRGHNVRFGGPGWGGVGANFFVMDTDGSNVVNLSNGEEGEDNFHAYWSPDGTRIAWTHVAWDIHQDGRGLWDIRLADYVDDERGPHLENIAVVRPANGHFYETQPWSPDGRGFLFTESVDNAMNLELFFLDLSRATPEITRLTNDPAWDEQAVFTPDGKKVIFMSTRDHPSTWSTWANLSWTARIPADADYLLVTPLFFGSFFTPVMTPATDLYELDLESRAVRRLTHDGDDGWVIPEFAWDPQGQRLLWSEFKIKDGFRISDPSSPAPEAQEAIDMGTREPPPSSTSLDSIESGRTRIARYVH